MKQIPLIAASSLLLFSCGNETTAQPESAVTDNVAYRNTSHFVFDDDALVADEYKSRVQNRGGSGILTLFNVKNRTSYYQRDIILGQNVSGYPNH